MHRHTRGYKPFFFFYRGHQISTVISGVTNLSFSSSTGATKTAQAHQGLQTFLLLLQGPPELNRHNRGNKPFFFFFFYGGH
jgi:hypothetical protein